MCVDEGLEPGRPVFGSLASTACVACTLPMSELYRVDTCSPSSELMSLSACESWPCTRSADAERRTSAMNSSSLNASAGASRLSWSPSSARSPAAAIPAVGYGSDCALRFPTKVL